MRTRCWHLLALLTSTGLLAGCEMAEGTAPTPAAAEPNVLTVNVAPANFVQNVSQTSSSFGTIKPRRSSSLGFARAGRVSKVRFDVGDFVAEGDKIAELDQGELVNQQEDLDDLLKKLNDDLELLQSQAVDQRLRQKEQEIAELTSQQTRLTREFEKGFIVAPYRGVLAERNTEVGDAVPAGRPFFRILEAGRPVIALNVPVRLAGQIQVGTQVWVRRGEEILEAEVMTMSPELDPSSRTQSLTLSIAEDVTPRRWNYGEVVEVQFLVPTENDGFWLPYSALRRSGGDLWSVFILEGDGDQKTIATRTVKLVQLEDTHALVIKKALVSGSIAEGDLIVVDGLNRVVPGQLVRGNLVPNDYQSADARGAGE
ncbi:MAG: efflux RND transporter periplasmic adaptor subunit [Planctomycetota bacterium]